MVTHKIQIREGWLTVPRDELRCHVSPSQLTRFPSLKRRQLVIWRRWSGYESNQVRSGIKQSKWHLFQLGLRQDLVPHLEVRHTPVDRQRGTRSPVGAPSNISQTTIQMTNVDCFQQSHPTVTISIFFLLAAYVFWISCNLWNPFRLLYKQLDRPSHQSFQTASVHSQRRLFFPPRSQWRHRCASKPEGDSSST